MQGIEERITKLEGYVDNAITEKYKARLCELEEKVHQIENLLAAYEVCNCCGCVYHDSFIRQQKCPACGEGV